MGIENAAKQVHCRSCVASRRCQDDERRRRPGVAIGERARGPSALHPEAIANALGARADTFLLDDYEDDEALQMTA